MPQRTIGAALKDLTDRVMSIPGVVGTAEGLCEGRPCLKVFLTKKTPERLRQIPAVLEGYRVTTEESGVLRPLGGMRGRLGAPHVAKRHGGAR